jgi:hypothetical protein
MNKINAYHVKRVDLKINLDLYIIKLDDMRLKLPHNINKLAEDKRCKIISEHIAKIYSIVSDENPNRLIAIFRDETLEKYLKLNEDILKDVWNEKRIDTYKFILGVFERNFKYHLYQGNELKYRLNKFDWVYESIN